MTMSRQATGELAIGLDVGATKIAGALVTRRGEVLAEARAAAPRGDVPAAMARMAEVALELAGQAHAPLAGIGVGTPGYVDPVAGIVRNAVNLGWSEVPVAAEVMARLEGAGRPLPVWVDNDTNVQALGETIFGAAQGLDNVVYVGIGSGLGSGLVIHGRLVAGDSYAAAEMGHLSLDPEGRRCNCGLRGCVETVVSGPGLVATVRSRLADAAAADAGLTSMDVGPQLTAEAVVAAAKNGDSLALDALAETARWLGMAFAAYVVVTNPAAIVVGGGLGSSAFEFLVPGARQELARRVPRQGYHRLQVLPSQVQSSAVGASSLVWQAR
jgi:glucokinase